MGRPHRARCLSRSGENPVSLGDHPVNTIAAYGAQSNKGADFGGWDGLPRQAVPADRRAGHECTGVAADVHLRQGRRDDRVRDDAIFAQQNGQALDYTVPDSTILIENPVAVTSNSPHPAQAKAFLDFLYTPTAPEDLAARTATARSCPARMSASSRSRRHRTCSRSTTSAAGRRSRRTSSTPDRLGHGDRAAARRADHDNDAEGVGHTLTTGRAPRVGGPNEYRHTAVAEPRAIPVPRLSLPAQRVLTTTRQRRSRQTKVSE